MARCVSAALDFFGNFGSGKLKMRKNAIHQGGFTDARCACKGGSFSVFELFQKEIALRKTAGFPPFADIVRIMVESDTEEEGIEALKQVYFASKEVYEQNMDKFMFFNKMKSPVKRINRKYRYQVLMRLKSGNEQILDKFYQIAEGYEGKALVYVEVNPNSLV